MPTPITLRQLELGIIRCAERWPDRVGLYGELSNADDSDRCIWGQMIHDFFGSSTAHGKWKAAYGNSGHAILLNAIRLNNAGTPWGEIPRLLGLVPGEQPVSQPEPTVEFLEPAEVV